MNKLEIVLHHMGIAMLCLMCLTAVAQASQLL